MSAFGSSVIRKSTTKVAPKAAAQRRRPGVPNLTQTSAIASVERQGLSQTPQPTASHPAPDSSSPPTITFIPTPIEPEQSPSVRPTSTTDPKKSTAIAIPTRRSDRAPQHSPHSSSQNVVEQSIQRRHPSPPLPEPPASEPTSEVPTENSTGEAQRIERELATVQTNECTAAEDVHKVANGATAIPFPARGNRTTSQVPVTISEVAPEPAAKRRKIETPRQKQPRPPQLTYPHSPPPRTHVQTTEASNSVPLPTTEGERNSEVVEPPAQIVGAKKKRKAAAKDKGKGKASANEASATGSNAAAKEKDSGRRRGRKRAKTPEMAESVEIAPSLVKMGDLCKDMRTGKKSEREKKLQEMDLTDLIHKQRDRQIRRERGELAPLETTEQFLERRGREREQIVHAAPQMRIVNGQVVLDQDSLQVDRHAQAALTAEQMEEKEENELTTRITAGSWLKREKTETWDEENLDLMYQGLRMFGTDFEMISKMFPSRTRRQIKLKFCKEEKQDPQRINDTLMGPRVPVDLEKYSELSQTVFEDPDAFNKELEAEAKRHEANLAQQKSAHEDQMNRRGAEPGDGEGVPGESSAKENEAQSGAAAAGGKRGKKGAAKKKKNIQAVFGGEKVEVLGTIEDIAQRDRAMIEV
ncbi:MAG: Transcription factor TFIIIB component B [Pycnora praestabilis]|nr:MAG: Transcription factor TFIIIB component B [Pycnora praestabilis]